MAEPTVPSKSFARTLVVSGIDEQAILATDEPARQLGAPLPFVVRLVRTESHLQKAVAVRAQAFLRHAPRFGLRLSAPEDADRKKGNVVFLAESKLTGDPVGSIRIETNTNYRTELEKLIKLPNSLQNGTLAQVSRLGVSSSNEGSLAKHSLFKAIYLFALATQIDHLIVAARSPVDKEFIRLGFREIFEEPILLSFPSQGEKLLKLFAFTVASAEREWLDREHPLYDFMIATYHPDIEIFSSVRGMWSTPRFIPATNPQRDMRMSPALPFPAA